MNLKNRLTALEQVKNDTLIELPMIVSDNVTDEEILLFQDNGRMVFRENDVALFNEFI
jgi:predicted molibdopterin-dependent oxidoreductase YjgC